MDIKVIVSNICTAHQALTIGSRILNRTMFNALLEIAIQNHDFNSDRTKGQAVLDLFFNLPKHEDDRMQRAFMDAAVHCVSSGFGQRSKDPEDYIARFHREQVQLFLKREHAGPVKSLRAVVYTKEAYLNDPDVFNDSREIDRIVANTTATHVLVAVLAGPVEGFVSPYRFVANLAGGNLDYREGKMKYAELVRLANDVKDFDDKWVVVSD